MLMETVPGRREAVREVYVALGNPVSRLRC